MQAAVFNQTEISFALMDHGASLVCKNSQGKLISTSSEFPFDVFGERAIICNKEYMCIVPEKRKGNDVNT